MSKIRVCSYLYGNIIFDNKYNHSIQIGVKSVEQS